MVLIGGIIFFGGLVSILLNREHILILLLCLELMYLGILYNMFMGAMMMDMWLNLILFMFLVVCEAGLGLSVLVSGVYYYGNDKVSSILVMKC
nr:NADH dehydrogenase subunit 4L [Alectorobius spheniscus]